MSNVLTSDREGNIIPSVLFTGETGTGKTFAAHLLSQAISKRDPLTVNCASLDKEHIDVTLFGTPGGMWTDVKDDVVGCFEAAGDGVLFLDEIGELPLESQAHLLSVLQDRVFRPHTAIITRKKDASPDAAIKPPKPIPVKCKIIFGTNKDLFQEVREGRFRSDLYYRINALEVTFPKISERFAGREYNSHGRYIEKSPSEEKQNGLEFIENVRTRFCKEFNNLKMTPGAIASFQFACLHLQWKGNFRDIKSLFARLHILSSAENEHHIVGQHMVEEAISAMRTDVATTSAEDTKTSLKITEVVKQHSEIPQELLSQASKGKTAIQINTLTFALKCASTSTSLKQAAKICYAGTNNNSNISSKFKNLLKTYGIKFDASAQGHVSAITDNQQR